MPWLPYRRFLLLLFLLAAGGCAKQLQPWEELKERHATTSARITGTKCADHGNISYEFRASGRTYVGKTYGIDRPCESVRPGDRVLVYFHPGMPGINSTMPPEQAYEHHKSQAYMWLYLAGFLVLGLALSVFSSLREISAEDQLISSQRKHGNPPS